MAIENLNALGQTAAEQMESIENAAANGDIREGYQGGLDAEKNYQVVGTLCIVAIAEVREDGSLVEDEAPTFRIRPGNDTPPPNAALMGLKAAEWGLHHTAEAAMNPMAMLGGLLGRPESDLGF